jgi:PEP-CTERM motif
MERNATVFGTNRVILTCSSVLALTLGTGAPAHANLIITPFNNPGDTTTLNSGTPVNFGPYWNPNGFTAQMSFGFPFTFFTLTGNGGNTVAIDPSCTGSCPALQVFHPGDSIDSSLTFGPTGSFKTGVFDFDEGGFVPTAPDGDYYFGLSDIYLPAVLEDPFGWIEITLNNGDVTLDRFAFEDTTNPALIPQDVPEPATLALFAVGAAAVMAGRRRRRAQAA